MSPSKGVLRISCVDERPATAADVDVLFERVPWLRDVFPEGVLQARVEESLRSRKDGR